MLFDEARRRQPSIIFFDGPALPAFRFPRPRCGRARTHACARTRPLISGRFERASARSLLLELVPDRPRSAKQSRYGGYTCAMGCMLRVVRSCGSDRQAATACSQLTDMLQSWTGWRRCGRASRTSTTTRSSRRCLRSLTAWTSSARQLRCTAGACNMRQTTYSPSRIEDATHHMASAAL